ncbi:asparagine synthase (glutamine-hydrolyzing) [Paenibacillus sp. GbtcB18]|uniref:asparagine synthase (glutamine-hydrolyzing) n=1 Tax=Paenibacillus sp. GbtcB18 TaxID=2824763 RepID=UPI001C3045D7|nr:asparagine synthase (glutamine-hydrolyzing) [Paenibacillus sp. GbtcB18]
MCGVLFTDDPSVDKELFVNSLRLIEHRGPDKSLCYWEHTEMKMGHNRLSILDIDDRSNQPFQSEDGRYVMIYNGEIYNYLELAKQFDLLTRTSSDTEVLLQLYIRFGPNMLSMLNGMFALIILDTSTNQVFVARDRLGVKPLYYYRNRGNFTFSSEIAPILELHKLRKLDPIGIRQYKKMRTFFNDRTIYEDIRSFPAGCYMIDGKVTEYWKLDMDTKQPPSDEELADLLKSSVRYREISDVSIGSYLSGGLDSTIVTALSNVTNTWTVGFESYNEFIWSNLAAERYGTDHCRVTIQEDEFLTLADAIINRKKEPISVPNEVLLYKMTQEVSKKNKVVLSGEGADELFFGYDRIFRWAASVDKFTIDEFSSYYSYSQDADLEIVEDAIKPFLQYETPLHIVSAFFQIAHLQGLLKRLDSATMLCGVEARSPFVDYRLVERLAGVGADYKMKDNIVKAPLKRVFKDILPNEIIDREKVGFPVKVDEIFSGNNEKQTGMDKWFDYNLNKLMEVL